MRKFQHIFISCVSILSLCVGYPAISKSVWLKCGEYNINLDDQRERYSIQTDSKVFQGSAMFAPSQISFEFQPLMLSNGGGFKYNYIVNRKTLAYSRSTLHRYVSGGIMDSGWVLKGNDAGICAILKIPPSTGNQI